MDTTIMGTIMEMAKETGNINLKEALIEPLFYIKLKIAIQDNLSNCKIRFSDYLMPSLESGVHT
ncbi:hypothetical protein J2X17_001058 [Flavobacterium aquidurense]|nr:hypothetical protein [Flavobacterium aquidurense]